MIESKETKRTIIDSKITKLKCDICERNILKGKKEDEIVDVATLNFNAVIYQDATAGMITDGDSLRREASHFCGECYQKLIDYIKGLGAKVPSEYLNLLDSPLQKELDEEMENFDDWDVQ